MCWITGCSVFLINSTAMEHLWGELWTVSTVSGMTVKSSPLGKFNHSSHQILFSSSWEVSWIQKLITEEKPSLRTKASRKPAATDVFWTGFNPHLGQAFFAGLCFQESLKKRSGRKGCCLDLPQELNLHVTLSQLCLYNHSMEMTQTFWKTV